MVIGRSTSICRDDLFEWRLRPHQIATWFPSLDVITKRLAEIDDMEWGDECLEPVLLIERPARDGCKL